MNKSFLQQVFSARSGQVYAYTGTVPEGLDPNGYITEKFVTAVGNNLLDTVVVGLPSFNTTVVYTDGTVDVNSQEFNLVTDLIPDPEPEVPAEPAPAEPAPEAPVEGS